MAIEPAGLLHELAVAARIVRARARTVVPVLLVPAVAAGLGEALRGVRWAFNPAGLLDIVALVATVLVMASTMRAYAAALDRTVAPARGAAELIWAAIWTAWPCIVVLLLVIRVLRYVYLPPGTLSTPLALAVFLAPAAVALTIQGWAFSYVAVDGASATSAINGVLRSVRRRAILARALIVTVAFSIGDVALWGSLQWIMNRVNSPAGVRFAVYVVVYVASYAYLWAVLVTTRPVIPALLGEPGVTPARRRTPRARASRSASSPRRG